MRSRASSSSSAGASRAPVAPGGELDAAGRLLALQRAAGNRAVAGALAPKVLARQAATTWAKDAKLDPTEIERLYDQAVAKQDWRLLLAVVNSFAPDSDDVRLLRPIQRQGGMALALASMLAVNVFQWDADHPVRRALAFLRVEDQTGRAARTPRNNGWSLGDANGGSTTVPGGVVNVYDEVTDPRRGRHDHFALQYKGLDSDNTGWLQFVAAEVEAFDAGTGGEGDYESGTMTGTGQPETLDYDTPDSPDWHLDTRSAGLPFYEAASDATGEHAGAAIIEYPANAAAAGETTMIDRPQADPAIVEKVWGRHVHRVERRVRCHQYLVRGEDVLFENELVVQDTYWNPSDRAVRRNLVGKRGPADKLQPAHHSALVRRRPEFDYFAH